ncbi:NEDD8-conjugating protein ubc12 [Coemansia sp. RSA 1813]|nr:NEDD8-conjugating protein ubc12 [Coemansia sp. RSA 1646]KAJ1768110.1 NEDD8-conjugating protein ubc12 [Coemansia sp. RSA 1843]KAJ2088033.1 NEDD8-conjugating protein ubc12 [Coemansia sp. RSA 986]KAJ2211949.1 NEDD8-conjugating protein ubc12 [Coemansia sp. RSA 487]KAJ2565871.1 NEDD8-conjugating protein ubc12 [Coemansia sp. RSA 1813]
MHKLWQKKKMEAEALKNKPRGSPARLRLQKELSELDTSEEFEVKPSDDLMHFTLVYRPPAGHYHGGEFKFTFDVSENYPHEPPKVLLCEQTIFHPNIDTEGHICLNVLREDWKPVLNIQSVIFGLQLLFLEPNADDPLNKDAAAMMVKDHAEFVRTVKSSMQGHRVNGIDYTRVIIASSQHSGHYSPDSYY